MNLNFILFFRNLNFIQIFGCNINLPGFYYWLLIKMSTINFVLTYSKRHYCLNIIKRFYASPVYSTKHVELITEMTECSKQEAHQFLKNKMNIQSLDEEEVRQRLIKLNMLELEDNSRLDRVALVKHHPKTVKHRYLILKECGVEPSKINTLAITNYLTYTKLKISTLKRRKFLAEETNVTENLLRHTPLSSNQLDYTFMDWHSPDEIKSHIMRKLLIDVVGYSELFKEESVLFKRLRHKSISETLRNLDVLKNQVGLPMEKIRNNPFLLSASDADNTLSMLSIMPTIAGVDIKAILNMHPKIMASSIDGLLNIHDALKEAGITDEALSRCFEVFTLNSDTVRTRLRECSNHEFFSAHRHHPRILELIMYHNKAKERLDRLLLKKVDFVSLSILASSEKYFQRYLDDGAEKYHHGMDVVYFLSEELQCDRITLKKKLQKHPYWFFCSLVTISTNLKALLDRQFTRQQILDQVYILLYPTKLMLDEVDKVCERKESDVCRDSAGLMPKSTLLSLALYYIERESDFTGSAVLFKEP